MASINKVTLFGNLGKDPEVKNLTSGAKLCNFSLATSESWKDKATGERKEKTEWHNVVIWDERIVDRVERFLKKGDKVWLEGQLETRSWDDQDGKKRYTTEVVLRSFRSSLEIEKCKAWDKNGEGAAPAKPAATKSPAAKAEMDDEIPF